MTTQVYHKVNYGRQQHHQHQGFTKVGVKALRQIRRPIVHVRYEAKMMLLFYGYLKTRRPLIQEVVAAATYTTFNEGTKGLQR